jgi:outer membrane biosynthesis protein TonB
MSPWQGQWQRDATRLGVALSLLLHAAALLLYLALAEPPAPLPQHRPFFVELIGPGGSPPAIESTDAAGGTDRHSSRQGSTTAGPAVSALPDSPTPLPAMVLSPPPPPAPPSPPSPSPPSPSLPPASSTQEPPEVASTSSRSWFEANGLGAAPAARATGPADLSARAPRSLGAAAAGAAAGGDPGQPFASAAPAARVGTLLRQASGRARIRTGQDPAWSPLSEKLRAHFQPDWSLLEEGPQPTGIGATGLARTVPEYLKMAERFARSERLSDADGVMGERTSEAGKVVDRLVAAGSQSSTGLGPPVERGENPFQRTYLTLVEVAHRDDGSVADIRLRQQSGNAAVDRLALAATRRAVAESDQAAWAGKARTSVWAFTAILGIVPPVPALGCPPDVLWTGRFDRCAYPLKKLSGSQVELEAIE